MKMSNSEDTSLGKVWSYPLGCTHRNNDSVFWWECLYGLAEEEGQRPIHPKSLYLQRMKTGFNVECSLKSPSASCADPACARAHTCAAVLCSRTQESSSDPFVQFPESRWGKPMGELLSLVKASPVVGEDKGVAASSTTSQLWRQKGLGDSWNSYFRPCVFQLWIVSLCGWKEGRWGAQVLLLHMLELGCSIQNLTFKCESLWHILPKAFEV